MARLQIEALELIQFGREMGGPMHQGDRRTFEEPEQIDEATDAISSGWAKDVAGNIPTGERTIVGRVVQPHSTASDQSASEAN